MAGNYGEKREKIIIRVMAEGQVPEEIALYLIGHYTHLVQWMNENRLVKKLIDESKSYKVIDGEVKFLDNHEIKISRIVEKVTSLAGVSPDVAKEAVQRYQNLFWMDEEKLARKIVKEENLEDLRVNSDKSSNIRIEYKEPTFVRNARPQKSNRTTKRDSDGKVVGLD